MGIQEYTGMHKDTGGYRDTRIHRGMKILHTRVEADSKRLP